MTALSPSPAPRRLHRSALAEDGSEITSLTGLRIVAAVWVLIFHLAATPGGPFFEYWQPVRPIVASGALGVDLFFVLSGFVIAYTYFHKLGRERLGRHRMRATVSYLWARLARIWPVYTVVTVVVGLWLVWRASSGDARITFQAGTPDLGPVSWLVQLLGVQQWFVASCYGCSFAGPAWSVSAEWLAYLCFPVLMLLFWPARRLPAVALGGLAMLVLAPFALHVYATGQMYFPWAWAARIGAGFTAGVLAYLAVRRIPRTPRVGRIANLVATVAVVQIVVGVFWADTRPTSTDTVSFAPVVTVFFPVLIGALALSDGRLNRWLSTPAAVHGGRISYSLYLVHIPIFEVYWTAMEKFDSLAVGTPNAAFLLPQVLLLSLVTAHLLFRGVEEPARRWLRRFDPARRPAGSAAVTKHRSDAGTKHTDSVMGLPDLRMAPQPAREIGGPAALSAQPQA